MTGFLSFLVGGALMFEFALFMYSVGAWNEPGRVVVRSSGQTLGLQGAPGDTVRLTLPLPIIEDGDYRELSAEFRGSETPTDATLLPLNASVDESDSETPAVRATLVVPDLSVGTQATGRLFGPVRSPNGEVHTSLNVPLTLRVLGPGEGLASGTGDMQFHRFRLVVFNLLLVAAAGWLLALASATDAWERRRPRQEAAA